VHVRFIELMPIGGMTAGEACGAAAIEAMRAFGAEPGDNTVTGAGPARYYQLDGAPGSLGLIAPMSDPFCDGCNRLRLSAHGRIRSCLFAAPTVALMPLLRPRADVAAIAQVLSECWRAKPSSRAHPASDAADASMCQIGG
jgi:cyclic pyranopterin phosphate synthase